ncbi:alpha/beta fold hydrolase [Neosynechococcus sphagnicola]|uniref:alpha/beta fold hydrolase n=1 Tax=Neosynechococcus sphagnicola TaxID=1501145 RepID=UPI0005606CC9
MANLTLRGVPHTYDLTAPTGFPHVLVFIHGWMLSRAYWQPLIQQLAPDYQCLSYDLRGFGQSQPGDSSLAFSGFQFAAIAEQPSSYRAHPNEVAMSAAPLDSDYSGSRGVDTGASPRPC